MSNITNPLDIIKRLDVKQNVTIRVIDEPTGKVVQEHIGHNAATNSLLTGIAHYLMGDGVLNQGADTLMMWVPQYISLGTMGLTSQNSEELIEDGATYIVPAALGYTPVAPAEATAAEKELNAQLRFEEYLNQTPGFGADGYDDNSNNDREWFGLGYPYDFRPSALKQNFYSKGDQYILTETPKTESKDSIISITIYPDGVVNEDIHNTSVPRSVVSVDYYNLGYNDNGQWEVTFSDQLTIPDGSRIAIIYMVDSPDAANCELIRAELDTDGTIAPITLRAKITYRDMVPEVSSEVPNTLDVIYSAMISTGALKEFRGAYIDPETQQTKYKYDYVYITEAGLWAKPNFNDSGDNGLLAGYRIMPSDDEVNILGVEKTIVSTGAAEYSLVDQDEQPLSILSIDSITCDSTEQIETGDGTTTEFDLIRDYQAILDVTVDGISVTYTISEPEHDKVILDSAPIDEAKIVITYRNDVIPSAGYTFTMEIGNTKLDFENGYIPTAGQIMIMVYRSGDMSGTWKDMTIKANREKVQKSILRIGENQVAQIVWKLQLGGLEQLNGLRYLYPSQYPEEVWNIV